jgi:hypothetical protein
MNHSFIRRVLLLGALLLGGFAHAETEDIPLPGDVPSAPLKSAKKSAHHAPASQADTSSLHKKAGKPSSRKHHATGKKQRRQYSNTHGVRHGKQTAAANHKPAGKATVHKKNASKSASHKASKNNKLAKKPVRKHKKMH